jgi:hypothetical protein
MGISNSLLNSTGTIVSEFRKVEAQTANQHSVMREASEEIDWP